MTEIAEWNAAVRPRNVRRQGAQPPPKPGSTRPFKHAQIQYMQVLQLKAEYQHDLSMLQAMINTMPPYVSRGHGGKHRTKNRVTVPVARSKYQPHQGKSEMARRAFQALPAAQRAFVRRVEGQVTE